MLDYVELVGGGSHIPCLLTAVEEGMRPFVAGFAGTAGAAVGAEEGGSKKKKEKGGKGSKEKEAAALSGCVDWAVLGPVWMHRLTQ
jgi:hypothetical protein